MMSIERCLRGDHLWIMAENQSRVCSKCYTYAAAPEVSPGETGSPESSADSEKLDDSAWDRLIEAASAVATQSLAPSNAAGTQNLAALYQQAVAVGVIQPTTTYQ